VTGLTFPAGDADALARCLESVVADPERVTTWRQAIVPPKTMAAHVEEIERLYREVRAERAPARRTA
jgi:hypothetical protein